MEAVPERTDTQHPPAVGEPEPGPAPVPGPGAVPPRSGAPSDTDGPVRLNAAEQRLWESFPTGAWVDLGDGDPATAQWGPDRCVRAEVIAELLLGAREPAPGHVAALRLAGARITGRLQLSGGRVDAMLRLARCRLDEPLHLTEAETRRLRITDSVLPGVEAAGLRVDGYLSLSGCTIDGPVRLPRASLSSGLRLNGTRIRHPGGWAMYAGAMSVGGGTFAREIEVVGGIRLTGARLGGGLFLERARLTADEFALHGDNMQVEDIMECTGLVSRGEIRLRGATVNGTLSLHDADLTAGGSGRALTLARSDVQELILSPRRRIEGTVSLTHARAGILIGLPELMPRRLHLNGFVFDSLRPYDVPVKARISTLNRHPDGFRSHPYEQLADWYRRTGRDDLARRTQLAKMRARRSTLRPPGRLFGYLLDWTVGYGYRSWQAAGWLVLLLTAGTTVFAAERPRPIKPPDERPQFDAFIYSLDLLIPISTFGQQEAWDPVGWTRWAAYTLIAAGWILATALIAGVTRVLRPN